MGMFVFTFCLIAFAVLRSAIASLTFEVASARVFSAGMEKLCALTVVIAN